MHDTLKISNVIILSTQIHLFTQKYYKLIILLERDREIINKKTFYVDQILSITLIHGDIQRLLFWQSQLQTTSSMVWRRLKFRLQICMTRLLSGNYKVSNLIGSCVMKAHNLIMLVIIVHLTVIIIHIN